MNFALGIDAILDTIIGYIVQKESNFHANEQNHGHGLVNLQINQYLNAISRLQGRFIEINKRHAHQPTLNNHIINFVTK